MALLDDFRLALDPCGVMAAADLTADGWQRDLLRSPAPRVLLCCCRQSGKSTTTAAMALHTALFQPDSLVLMLAPALRQSQELFRKVLLFYTSLGRPVAPEQETALTLTLSNGSRIVSLPGREGTVRGYSGVRLLVVDEAARTDDALYYSIRPMLAVSAGRIIGLSTPFGQRGWFYDAWSSGPAEEWERIQVTAEECPRISRAFLMEERISLGPYWYGSEYECRFLDTTDQVFSTAVVDAALDPDLEPLFQ